MQISIEDRVGRPWVGQSGHGQIESRIVEKCVGVGFKFCDVMKTDRQKARIREKGKEIGKKTCSERFSSFYIWY